MMKPRFDPLRFSQPPADRTEEQRRQMISELAYLRAEARGFATGHEEEDWLAAEAQVDSEKR